MKTLFVDFDGTICTDRFWQSLDEVARTQIQDTLFKDNHEMVYDWMRGKITSEEVNQNLANYLGIPYQQLWDTFVSDCSNMYVAPEILATIQTLRSRYYTVLITGNMDCFSRFTVPSLRLDQYFDTIVNSSDEGQLKTDNDGETFLKYHKGNITDAVLIEDSPHTCEVFTQLGGTAMRVTAETRTLSHLQSLL
jgi:FMN phosphatase YigB (HAD superfamily)